MDQPVPRHRESTGTIRNQPTRNCHSILHKSTATKVSHIAHSFRPKGQYTTSPGPCQLRCVFWGSAATKPAVPVGPTLIAPQFPHLLPLAGARLLLLAGRIVSLSLGHSPAGAQVAAPACFRWTRVQREAGPICPSRPYGIADSRATGAKRGSKVWTRHTIWVYVRYSNRSSPCATWRPSAV